MIMQGAAGVFLFMAVGAIWAMPMVLLPPKLMGSGSGFINMGGAGFDPFVFGMTMVELPLYALLFAWVFERANRSMAVAIAFHAGAHLDHIERAPRTELGLHAAHVAVLAIAAALAARSLARRA
jgi:hypothetical protein